MNPTEASFVSNAKPQVLTNVPRRADYRVQVLGAPRTPLRDFYHGVMRLSWPSTMALLCAGYFLANALFACAYLEVGGIAHARAHSFRDAFYFSVQTLGTIGYGAMFPESDAANMLVAVESGAGLILTALAAGMVFAKFSRPTARLLFTRDAAIAPMNGVPTLSFRIGNRRRNLIVNAHIYLALVRSERTSEGKSFYRTLDLKLARDRALSLNRSWSVFHFIDPDSPLYGVTPEAAAEQEMEVLVAVTGTDDTWMQMVHASHRYSYANIIWGARHADVLSESGNTVTLDLRKFHDLEPSAPTEGFPYPRDSS